MCERVYCINCEKWNDAQINVSLRDGCSKVISTDPEHPIKPQVVYGDYKVLNKDGKCPHFKDKLGGLGVVGEKNKLLPEE